MIGFTKMDDALYIEAAEAAALLRVSKETLYSYVSRKGLRSFGVERTRKRRYWRADIEALINPESSTVLTGQALVTGTELTLITDQGLFYRGRDASRLSETASLEQVATLLWNSEPDLFDAPPPAALPDLARHLKLLSALPPVGVAMTVLPLIEHANPRSADLSSRGFALSGTGVLRWTAAIMAGRSQASAEPIHQVIARAAAPDGRFDDLVRRALVLAADHELDPTTYAVRAAANTGVTPYGAAVVGLTVSRGQRLRHQRVLIISRFVREVLATSDPAAEVLRLYRIGEAIPGFSDPNPHKAHDPRADTLLTAMSAQLGGMAEFRKLEQMIAAATDLTGFFPDFILPITYLGLQLGYDNEPITFLTPGRMAGWLAHALEQFQLGTLIRPRAAYVGNLPD